MLNFYENNHISEFLARTFLYAIQKDNKHKGIDNNEKKTPLCSIKEGIIKIKEALLKLPKPKKLTPNKELEDHELVYTSQLIAAYAHAEGDNNLTVETLHKYPKYKCHFDRHREDYYAARTIRLYLKDTLNLDEDEVFDILKDEIYSSIIDVHEDNYSNPMDRINSVMKHATTVSLDKCVIASNSNLIGNRERKGVCHMLVNENMIKWVNE